MNHRDRKGAEKVNQTEQKVGAPILQRKANETTKEGQERGLQMMPGVEKVDREKLFSCSARTWGHPIKLIGRRSRRGSRKHFFKGSLINVSLVLSHDVMVDIVSDSFKRGLGKFMEDMNGNYQ